MCVSLLHPQGTAQSRRGGAADGESSSAFLCSVLSCCGLIKSSLFLQVLDNPYKARCHVALMSLIVKWIAVGYQASMPLPPTTTNVTNCDLLKQTHWRASVLIKENRLYTFCRAGFRAAPPPPTVLHNRSHYFQFIHFA